MHISVITVGHHGQIDIELWCHGESAQDDSAREIFGVEGKWSDWKYDCRAKCKVQSANVLDCDPHLSSVQVIKSTLEVIRFDAEIEDRGQLRSVLDRLDGNTMKLPNFTDSARIRAAEAKDTFPKRYDWDSFFRDARDMDEKKSGERPDTIHISSIPIRWFCPRHQENDDVVKPSESIFKRIFEKFGEVRHVDIPICDPYRKEMKSHMSGMKTFSFDQDLYFEAWVFTRSVFKSLNHC